MILSRRFWTVAVVLGLCVMATAGCRRKRSGTTNIFGSSIFTTDNFPGGAVQDGNVGDDQRAMSNAGVDVNDVRVFFNGDRRIEYSELVAFITYLGQLVQPVRVLGNMIPQFVMGSASALRGMRNASTYSAARGAQVAYVRAVGTEIAATGVQLTLIAQNFVENETYFPEEVRALPAFQERLRREVPAGRLGTPREDAMLAVFLASDECRFMTGQSVPFAGGWVT